MPGTKYAAATISKMPGSDYTSDLFSSLVTVGLNWAHLFFRSLYLKLFYVELCQR